MKEARIRSRKSCLGHKEMSLFHVTKFLECPSLGKGGRQEAKMTLSAWEIWEKLVKTCLLQVEVLVLVQLDGGGGEGDPLLDHPVQVGQVGRLPAPGRIVRIGSKDKTLERDSSGGRNNKQPEARFRDTRLFDQLQIMENKIHATC